MSPVLPKQLTRTEKQDRLDTVIERLRLGGKRLTTNVAMNLTAAEIEYGLETSYQLTLTVYDPNDELLQWKFLQSGLKAALRRSDGPGWDKFSLVSVDSQDSSGLITLTFEDEAVYRLRLQTGFMSANRNQVTRAEFIWSMIRETTTPTINFVSPQVFIKQPVAVDTKASANPTDTSDYGFSGDTVKVKGQTADSTQLEVLKKVLDIGVELKAPKLVLVAAVTCITEEAVARNPPNNAGEGVQSTSVGAFQQTASYGSFASRMDLNQSSRRFYLGTPGIGRKGAIQYYADNKNWQAWKICWWVQRNYDMADKGKNSYGRWVNEATNTVNAYLGDDADSYRGSTRAQAQKKKKYEFTRGDPDKGESESTWEAAKRLADEVQWRLYCYRGTVYYVSDDDLRARPHKTVLTRRRDGVISLGVNWDVGQEISEITANVIADRYSTPPGTAILVRGLGKAADQTRWLVANYRRSLFSPQGELTLHAPVEALPEPPEETESKTEGGGGGEIGTIREKIVSTATTQLSRTADFIYAQTRPYPSSFEQSPVRTDCSGFAIMCYKAAGAPDPNGSGYNGQGWTGSLFPRGTSVSKPKPGDLVFYGNVNSTSGHVAVVISETEAVGFGSQGGPRRHSITYRTPVGYRSYVTE